MRLHWPAKRHVRVGESKDFVYVLPVRQGW